MLLAVPDQIRHASHRPVLVHDLADDAGAGFSPASRARSTAASVCPVLCSTPPGRARSGNTCPGCTTASDPFVGSIATWIVRERSAAEMPS